MRGNTRTHFLTDIHFDPSMPTAKRKRTPAEGGKRRATLRNEASSTRKKKKAVVQEESPTTTSALVAQVNARLAALYPQGMNGFASTSGERTLRQRAVEALGGDDAARAMERELYTRYFYEAPRVYRLRVIALRRHAERVRELCQRWSPDLVAVMPIATLRPATQEAIPVAVAPSLPPIEFLVNPAGLLRCGHCRSEEHTEWIQLQTSSGDEGMTVFAHCRKCDRRWKQR